MFDFLSERDKKLLYLMAVFNGKTFVEVLAKTLWIDTKSSVLQARNRLQKLRQKKILGIKSTGLFKPKNAYVLNDLSREIVFNEFDINVTSNITVSPVSANHMIFEQIAFFWLEKIGRKVERTVVKSWSKNHKHTPDLAYFQNDKLIYVEIERSMKNTQQYNQIFVNIIADKVDKVLYIVEDEKMLKRFARNLPRSEKIMLVTIDDFVKNCHENGKIGAVKQFDLIEKGDLG